MPGGAPGPQGPQGPAGPVGICINGNALITWMQVGTRIGAIG
jgi:hypothetical protein